MHSCQALKQGAEVRHYRLRVLLWIVVFVTSVSLPLRAQNPSGSAIPAPTPVFQSERVPTMSTKDALQDLNASLRADDHRYEGAVVGAVVFGVGFALLASAGNSDSGSDPSPVLLGLGGAAVGGLLGLLIGGAIPKGQ